MTVTRFRTPPTHSPRAARLNDASNYALPIKMASMHGMGDNLHQRAIVRELMKQNVVYLDTPWPSIYHDLVGPQLYLVRPAATTLRTQAKNVAREAEKYHVARAPRQVRMVRTWYGGEDVRVVGSVLGAMAKATGVAGTLDFRMPVRQEWLDTIDAYIRMWGPTKPIMLYRPLVERTEWGGCASRNPDFTAYRVLFEAIRERFFVISIADLVPGKEWLVMPPAGADVELHQGELSFELLAALARRAALVYCSPGFAVPLAQAVETPVVCVFGGFEHSSSFSLGARYTPTLGIDPIVPCTCFNHTHMHQKKIDVGAAVGRLLDFVDSIFGRGIDACTAFDRIRSALTRFKIAPVIGVQQSDGPLDVATK